MITVHSVQIEEELPISSPLHVSKFFSLRGMWWSKRKARQTMILGIAAAWHKSISKQRGGYGFIEEEVYLTSLTSQVSDIKPVFEKFFHIKEIGYNFNNGLKSSTKCTPKKLPQAIVAEIDRILNQVTYYPGIEPTDPKLTVTHTQIVKGRTSFIRQKLKDEDREDLLPMVNWLLKQDNPIKFYYKPSGRLQARDTSVWPIRCIEQWPGWLRTELFGAVVDIDTSYCQYLISNIARIENNRRGRPELLALKYPDIMRLLADKQEFRRELIEDYLRLPVTEDSTKVIKRILMALANGSNCSEGLITSEHSQSQVVRVVREECPHLGIMDLAKVGDRLRKIVNQFRNAKRAICVDKYGKPSRQNMKKVFEDYFMWEREARHKIWEMAGFTGLALHDGLDGIVVNNPATFAERVLIKYGLRVTVENYEDDQALRSIPDKSANHATTGQYVSSLCTEV